MLLSRDELYRAFNDPRLAWSRFAAGGLVVRVVPGDHEHVLDEPIVAEVAAELRALLGGSREAVVTRNASGTPPRCLSGSRGMIAGRHRPRCRASSASSRRRRRPYPSCARGAPTTPAAPPDLLVQHLGRHRRVPVHVVDPMDVVVRPPLEILGDAVRER